MRDLNIGFVGSGHVAKALGTAWADRGHFVMLGSRDPAKAELAEWVAADLEHRHCGDQRTAVIFGDVVVMAVAGRLLPQVIEDLGREIFEGKIVLDPTNPFVRNDAGEWTDLWSDDDSGAEFLQRELPNASVVKAFNEILYFHMPDPKNSPVRRVRIAGDDRAAKETVVKLARELGWRSEDLGPLAKARVVEQSAVKQYA